MTDDKKKFQSEWEKLLAPSPTRPKSTAPISGVLSEPEMEDILRQAGWPESEVPYMAKMGTKESSGKVSADRVRRAGQGQRLPESSYGLWQINTLAHPQYDPDRLARDPVYNAKAALEVFQKQGYNAWFNSRRKLAAEGILPGNVQSAAPQATVEDLFPNVNGFATATATVPAVESVEDLFPNVDGFKDTNVGSTPTNPTGAYVPLDPKASAIPQSPLDVGIPAYTPPAQTTQVENPSRPNERPVLKRKDERALAPVKPRATVAVGSEPEIGRAEEDYGTIVDQGVYVQDHRTLGRKGDKTGNVVKTVTVDYTPERRDRQYTARRAAEQVAADYDLSADQVAQLSDRLASAPLLSEGSSADQYYITKDDIAAVKGDLNLPTVEARPFVEIPPESLFTPELAEKGLLDVPLVGAAGDVQNTAAGVVASGGRVWQALAGLYRIADDLNKRPFGDGTNRFINPQKEEDIKVYQGDDIYKYMMSVANDAQAPANSLAKFGGTRAEFFQMAGGLPGDFSRIMIMSATPGGIVTGMSADMAMQAAGRGESYDQVAKEGLKGALFGSIARFATPVGQGIAQNTGSRVAGGAGSLAFTGAATYPVSRVFGADVKTALKETLFNTIFAMADAAPVLLGKKIRVKDTEGSQVVVEIKQDGTAQEIELSKDQPADIEVLDSEAAEGTRKYEDQRLEAARIVYEQRQRPIVERMAEAEFTVGDKGDSLAANPAAISVLNDLLIENQKSLPEDFEGFHGLAMTDGTAIGAFTKWAENKLDEAQAAGNAGDMVTISNFITKLKEAGTQTQGRAALFADYKDLPEYTQGTRSEELTHLKNDLAGVQRVADFIAELPGAKTLLGFLDKVYDTSTKPVRVDEAIAQSFRADAPEHLGRSKQEIRRAQQELFRTLKETEDFDVNAYAESLEGISKRGDVFARYARQVRRAELSRERGLADVTGRETAVDPDVRGVLEPRRPGTGESSRPAGSGTGGPAGRGDLPNAAENSFESGDLVTIRGGEMLPYQIQKITGDQVDLIEAGSVDPDSVITLPLSEIELLDDGGRSKLGPVLRTEEVDLFENINDAEAVVDNSSLYKSSFEDQVAGTRPATQSNINPERVSYLNSILQGKDPKITTAKVGGQDVTFLGNNKSKVMLQPDEVPFVEQALRDPLFAQLWGRSDIAPAKTFQEHLSKIEGQDRDTLFGRFRRRKLETDSPTPTPTPTSLFEESGPPKEWLAKHKEIQDTAVSKAKDVLNSLSPRVRFAVNGNWMYGVDLSHGMWVNKPWEFREGFRNALDKLNGADKTELLESGVEEKLTTLFETAYKEVEAAKQTEESRNSWLAADYSLSEGRSPGYDPSGTEQWLGDIDVTRIQFAQLYHGSRHRFMPEIKVRNKQTGEEKYIAAEKAQDFPVGTRVSRRGDNIIVRHSEKDVELEYNGHATDPTKYPEAAAAEDLILEGLGIALSRGGERRDFAEAKETVREVLVDTNTDLTDQQRALATQFLDAITEKDFNIKAKPSRELIPADSWLPPVPEGHELVEKFPLGRIRDDKINTGEGAQVRGYGHYAAEKRGVASHYREAGAGEPAVVVSYKGQNIPPATVRANALSDVSGMVDYHYKNSYAASSDDIIRAAIHDTRQNYERILTFANESDKVHYAEQLRVLDSVKPEDFNWDVEDPHPGYLYRLKSNVPEERLLVLDKQLKDQSEAARDAIEQYKRENFGGNPRVETGDIRGEDFYRILSYEMSRLSGVKKGDIEASSYLEELGVKGLKFLDQDSRYEDTKDRILYDGVDVMRNGTKNRAALFVAEQMAIKGTDPQATISEVQGEQIKYLNTLKVELEQIKSDEAKYTVEQDGSSWMIKNPYGEPQPAFRSKEAAETELANQSIQPYYVDKIAQTEQFIKDFNELDPSKFERKNPKPLTYNHVLFSGDDLDVTRIMFAKVFKDNRIFDAKTKQEVLDFGAEEFPHLFSLLGRKSTGKPLVTNPNVAAGERIQAARGMEAEGSVSKYAGMLVQLYQSFKRQFKEIDPNESIQMARTADSFRLMSNLNNWAKVQATNDVARITEGLTREQYDVFENVLILRDKQQAVEKGMKPGHGYVDLTDVETSLKEYERAAAADPAIAKALGEREALRRDTVQGLVDIGMLGEEALDNTRYFHRQVPQEASGNMFLSLGNRDLRVRKKGFEKKRTGEGDDYNTNYVESEIEWVSQAHAQIRKQGLLSEIDRAVNIANDLKTEAKITGADWRSLVPADHRIWQPKEGSYFYEAMAVPDQMLMKSLTSGLIPAMKQSDLQAVLAKGQRKPEWVLPKGVAKLMDEFSTRIDDLPHANLYSNAQASWKQWMLINPKNYLSYNLRNFISDLDAAMSYPGMITELPAAIKDIWGYSRSRNHPAAAEIELAIKDGVMDSGQTFAEIPDIGKLGVFKMFADTDQNILSRGMSKVWETMKGTTNARENWIRLAAYRHIKKKLEAGEIIYGASTPGQVQALTPGRQAAKLARELVGDYGGISEAGRAIRKHMIPFYSWLEINAPRYVRLLKNMPAEAKANSRSTGPRLAGRVLYDGTKMGAKLAALTAGINIWNHVMFPDLEEDLKKTDIGKRPHLIVGRNPDGSARIFQADTALRDAMDWLDLGDAVSDVYQLQTGQATVTDKLAEAAKAPVNRVVQGLGPFKAAGELVTGRSTFPTIFEKGTSFNLQTRPIRDRAEHLAQTFAVKGIYQRVMGRPVPPSSGPVGQASDWFLTTRVDPRESIFWHMKGKVQDYKKKIGKASPGSDPTDKGNTLFYYKQALRWNNEEAAARYLKQYKEEFGGTNAGLRASLKKTHPLGSLAKRDWDDFEKTLTPEEKEMLQIAVDYFEGNINK